jgi:hypothetical protein
MAKRQYQVMVDTWGSAPEYKRGRILDLDLDDAEAMQAFPYDARRALERGILIDLDQQREEQAAQQQRVQEAAERRERETTPPTVQQTSGGTPRGRTSGSGGTSQSQESGDATSS